MKSRLLFIIAIYIAWLPVFIIQKPLFMLYNLPANKAVNLGDYLSVIWHGLSLDLSMAGYLTAIPLLLVLVAVWLPGHWLKMTLKGYFLAMSLIVSAIFAADMALYSYWGFRLDATVLFYLETPADAMASVPIRTFFTQIIVFLVNAWLVYMFFTRLVLRLLPKSVVRSRVFTSLSIILMGGLMFIPIRGGVTTSTANVGMVYFSDEQFLNHSAINPCFSLVASISKQQDFDAQFNFYPEEERSELFNSLMRTGEPVTSERVELLNTKKPNILIILLESFSANAVQAVGGEPGVTPHLNELSKEGVLFTNFYANSFRTDRGIVSVLNGYPAQPTTSIMKYPPKSQTLPSIAKSLGEAGYVSDMLYGGDINFTNMQSYFYSSGYSHITADRDFPLSSRLSKWGANDNHTFNWLFSSISDRQNSDTPWMTTFLTLSSHEPFEVPYHRLEHPYLNSVAFTDSCLGDFIQGLKQLPVWDDLLVILVSDHGFRYPEIIEEYEPQRYHIPMLWIGGAINEPRVINTYASQIDIAKTLLRQLDLPTDEYIFSKDIMDPSYPNYSFYTYNNGFGFIDTTGVSVYNNESDQPLIEVPLDQSSLLRVKKGKALLQTLYDDLGSR